jgi:hypothetical protein
MVGYTLRVPASRSLGLRYQTIRILKEYIEQQKTPLPETVPYIPALKREVLRQHG